MTLLYGRKTTSNTKSNMLKTNKGTISLAVVITIITITKIAFYIILQNNTMANHLLFLKNPFPSSFKPPKKAPHCLVLSSLLNFLKINERI